MIIHCIDIPQIISDIDARICGVFVQRVVAAAQDRDTIT
jgi:hypothetical protein